MFRFVHFQINFMFYHRNTHFCFILELGPTFNLCSADADEYYV